jgi:hypothetical protein
VDGKPQAPEKSGFFCPKCKSPLRNLKGISKKNRKQYDFFACSDKKCDATYQKNGDGTPVFPE